MYVLGLLVTKRFWLIRSNNVYFIELSYKKKKTQKQQIKNILSDNVIHIKIDFMDPLGKIPHL